MRRWFTAAVAAFVLASAGVPADALDGQTRFSAVRVDVTPLRARGLGGFAETVAGDLQAALSRIFADRLGGPGPVLVVRVSGVSLNAYAGSDGRFGHGGGATNTDYLDGEALVIGRRGEVLLRHPQLSATPASSGGAWYDPASERRRVAALAEHYAWWLRRGLGLD
ncbi:hypothetical protein [Methylobacterium nodulans]|uniref:Uncharacterized protein n=1 Tax=Methylobacterium nodulans (strain LMG 21967 / CNCM I-2342 / ORS 2060) TaxID=460265 RepID=B8IBN7_METNO|nr:hypothetical protein [Methylobacterium nodulans]ACL59291.1 conserved hypothetical protein [Methylobacterium nodulans ORS 2060]